MRPNGRGAIASSPRLTRTLRQSAKRRWHERAGAAEIFTDRRALPVRALRFARLRVCQRTEVIEHEQPNTRRQVAFGATVVDHPDQCRYAHSATARNLLEALPKGFLETDAGLVP